MNYMNDLSLSIIGFSVCSSAIIFSGIKLTKYGDAIAELTGMGKAWVGLILMASVTSLPELFTGISSVAFVNEPDLAAGDVFGSCIFNLLILSFVDARIKKPLTSLVKSNHLFTGLLGIILIAISGYAILLGDFPPVLFWVSPFTIVLIVTYVFAVYGIYQLGASANISIKESDTDKNQRRKELKEVVIKYALNALLVIAAAIFLPVFGGTIADQTGLGNTFFGTLFLAASTSLPELVVSFSAIKMESYDLLVGNLLGSNIFNMVILGIDDIFYTQGSIYAHIDTAHIETIIVVVMMTAVVGLGIMVKPTRKYWRFSYDTLIILMLYIGLMSVMYFKR
jgi:cation:H+ antiporter